MKIRKNYLINPYFQLTFLAYMVGVTFLAIIIFYGADIYFFRELVARGQQLSLPPDHVFFRFLAEQKHLMNLIFAVTSAILLVCLCVAGLLFSHRVAGPLYKLKGHLDALAAGRAQNAEVSFRKNDFFREVAAAFNSYVKACAKK